MTAVLDVTAVVVVVVVVVVPVGLRKEFLSGALVIEKRWAE